MPNVAGIKRRVRQLQEKMNPPPKMYEIPIYDCIIDGEHKQLELLDIATVHLDGKDHQITIGGQCGARYEQEATPQEKAQRLKDFQAWFKQWQDEYNSPEAVEKRRQEYEELQRIGELRRQDFLCGRDMDKCHPLPFK